MQDGRQYHGGPRRLQRVRQERGFIDVAREERGTQLGDTHRQEQGRRHVRGHAGPWDETPDERNERQEHDFQQLRNEEPDRGPELRYHIAAQIRVATVRRAMLAVDGREQHAVAELRVAAFQHAANGAGVRRWQSFGNTIFRNVESLSH